MEALNDTDDTDDDDNDDDDAVAAADDDDDSSIIIVTSVIIIITIILSRKPNASVTTAHTILHARDDGAGYNNIIIIQSVVDTMFLSCSSRSLDLVRVQQKNRSRSIAIDCVPNLFFVIQC